MSNQLLITYRDASFVVAAFDRIVLAITEGDARAEGIGGWKACVELMARSYPDGIGIVFVIGETAIVPSGAVRATANEFFATLEGKTRIMATVIEGSGFATATKRAAFTLISKASIGKVPSKVHPGVLSACEWLVSEGKKLGLVTPPAAQLAGALAGMPRPSARG